MKLFWLLLGTVLGPPGVLAQTPAGGMLLVASPDMRDPRFTQTVVLLLHHEAQGTLGVAINRPTWVEPSAAFPEMDFLGGYRGNIYFGGPVGRANVLALVRDPENAPNADPLTEGVYLIADPEFLREVSTGASTDRRLRMYAGHASWDAGQLEREIAAGRWRVLPASAEHVFSPDPRMLWQDLLALASEMRVGLPPGRGIVPADAG